MPVVQVQVMMFWCPPEDSLCCGAGCDRSVWRGRVFNAAADGCAVGGLHRHRRAHFVGVSRAAPAAAAPRRPNLTAG